MTDSNEDHPESLRPTIHPLRPEPLEAGHREPRAMEVRPRAGGTPARPHDGPLLSPAGFSLIEILIVITVIGIIAGIAIPGLVTALDRARQASSASGLRSLGVAIGIYQADNGFFPQVPTVDELIPTLQPYADSLSGIDGWKHTIVYRSDPDHYSLESYGKDGVDGDNITPSTRYTFALDIVYSDGAFTGAIE